MIESLAAQSTAVRHGGQLDRREASLRLVREALALGPDQATLQRLRNEAIAALALPATRIVLPEHLPPSGDAMMLCIDPNFTTGTVMAADDHLRLIRLADGVELRRLSIRSRTADQVQDLGADGRFLMLRRGQRSFLWNLDHDREVPGVEAATGLGMLREDGGTFCRGEAGGLACYSLPDLARTFVAIAGMPADISIVAALDEDRVIVGLANNELAVAELSSARLLWRQRVGRIAALAVAPDRRHVAAGCSDGRIHVVDVASGEPATSFSGFGEYIIGLTFDRTGGQLIAADIPGTLRSYGLPAGELLLKQQLLTWQLRLDPTGTRLGPIRQGDRFGWLEIEPARVIRTLRPVRVAAEPRLARVSP
ncbi:MAG TPA: hypothetical protein DCY13_16235, partial [Verrucomicrobiales bacterium]|nr:hypothetical protein [Verrucomicrobiales bacterium]